MPSGKKNSLEQRRGLYFLTTVFEISLNNITIDDIYFFISAIKPLSVRKI